MSPPSGTITGKVTGGGTIAFNNASMPERARSFGYVAMGEVFIGAGGNSNCTPASPCPAKGHLNYVNHTTSPQVHINGKVTEITHFEFFPGPPGRTRGKVTFKGTDTKSGCGTFEVTVTDNDEPGIHVDEFGLDCGTESTGTPSTGDSDTDQQTHSGGNSQIHPPQSK